MWKFKENAKGNSASQNARIVKDKLEALPGVIDTIESLETGINETDDPQACDLVLTSVFESKDHLKQYANHPTHLEAVSFIKEVVKSRHVVDYTF